MPNGESSVATEKSCAEADFTRLFNLSLDLLCIAGLDGYFKRVNPSWSRVLGWSEAELLSRPVADFMHPDDRARTLEARAGLARGTPVQGLENRYLCKDGSFRWLSWQSVTEPGATTVFGVARDITERRQLEEHRLTMSKLEATRLLASGLAHDFNNLLTSLALNLEIASLCGPADAEQARYLREARRSVEGAISLVDQFVALTSARGAKRKVCHLPPLLQASMDLVLGGSGIRAECRVTPDLSSVEVDEAQIGQVIRGILLNAREATPRDGTVVLEADNVARPEGALSGVVPAEGWVRIRITDTGHGIEPEVLPKVFDAYFSTKQRGVQKGMGLGLTTCRALLQQHGGTIVIESRPHHGTTVTCCLPAWRSSDGSGAGI